MGGETTKRPHTAYTPEQRALALAALDANAGCVAATAAQQEMPRTTLEEWSKGRGVTSEVTELRDVARHSLADGFEDALHRILAAVTPEDIIKASLRDKMISAGIATDKLQLLRGDPTQVIQHQHVINAYQALVNQFNREPGEKSRILIMYLISDQVRRRRVRLGYS